MTISIYNHLYGDKKNKAQHSRGPELWAIGHLCAHDKNIFPIAMAFYLQKWLTFQHCKQNVNKNTENYSEYFVVKFSLNLLRRLMVITSVASL